MTIYESLKKAKKLIKDKKNWTQGPCAKNDMGDSCPPRDENACQFCAVGAIEKATGECLDGKVYNFINNFL